MPETASQTRKHNQIGNHRLNHPTISFYIWILKLSREYGYCFASNPYLARKQGRSESQIVRRIATLIAAGWLRREFIEGERRLYPVVIPSSEFSRRNSAPPKEREKVPLVLVPIPESADEERQKRAPRPKKTRTPTEENAHPCLKEAFPEALGEAQTDTDAQPATDPSPAIPVPVIPVVVSSSVISEMEKIGVWPSTIKKVAKTKTAEEIRRILADPKCKSAKDPGAWFGGVIRDGYRVPAPPPPPPPRYFAPPSQIDPVAAAAVDALKKANPDLKGAALMGAVLKAKGESLEKPPVLLHGLRRTERSRRQTGSAV